MITLRSTIVVAVSFVTAVAIAACTDAATSSEPDTGSSPSTASTTSTPPASAVDWLDKSLRVELGDEYVLAHCPGDAPFHCITRGGQPAGVVELASYPLGSLAEVRANSGRGERAALEAHVHDFLESVAAGRAQECGPAYRLRAEPMRLHSAADGLLVSYGFAGGVGDSPTERTIQWAGIRGDELRLLSMTAIDPDACVPRDHLESTTKDLAAVEPHLRRLAEVSPLPSAAPTA